MRRLALALTIACLSAFPVLAQPEAKIAQGRLAGVMEGTISEFKGIPFAAPPVGPLRWRAPQEAPGWSGVHDASAFGPVCPQGLRDDGARVRLPESEDCLTLNVWTPGASAQAKLPVMVWIYGGSFIFGGSAMPVYDGIELAQHGVVVVTLNYRLGRLGFLGLPALTAEHAGEPSGNFGLLDQIAALKWVQVNIAAFGGDPSNVTIFGESAGGMSVNDLIASPLSRGLFAKAISESGLGLTPLATADAAGKEGADFAARMNATGSPSEELAKLRAATVADIIQDQTQHRGVGATSPFVDGTVLPDQPAALFAAGKVARVPYLAGTNSDEATLMDAFHTTNDAVLKPFGELVPTMRKTYEADGKLTDDQFVRQVFSDSWFTSGAAGLSTFMSKIGEPAYVYRFAYIADAQRARMSGVGHGGEIPYVFGFTGFAKDPKLGWMANFVTAKDKATASMMENYWTDFAKTGDPNGTGLPQWDPTKAGASATLVINDETKSVRDFRKSQLSLIFAAWAAGTGVSVPN